MFQVLPFARVNQGIAFAKILEMLKKMRKVLSKPCTYHFSLQAKTWQTKLYFQLALSIPTEAIVKSFHSIFMLLFPYQKCCTLWIYKPNTAHSRGGGGVGTPFNALYGKVPPERRQVYQTVGNTRDDVFGRIGKIYRQSI